MSDSAGVIASQKYPETRVSVEDVRVPAGIRLLILPAGPVLYHILTDPPHAREIRGHHRARCLVSRHDQTRTGYWLPWIVGSISKILVCAGTTVTDVPFPDVMLFPDHRSSQSRTV